MGEVDFPFTGGVGTNFVLRLCPTTRAEDCYHAIVILCNKTLLLVTSLYSVSFTCVMPFAVLVNASLYLFTFDFSL